ncbi:MAG: hypothetical protein M5U12_21890 [Verrucomicrobia bacterium]|nr:hypothetical protein [Verrucomicrobiota bacterium]
MDGWRQWALVACAGLAWSAGAAGAGDSAVTATRTVLEQWVQTHQLLARTRVDWARDKDLLERTRALLQRELQGLEEQATRLETNQRTMAGERAAAEAQDTLFRAALDGVRGPLAQVEMRIRALEPVFPLPCAPRSNRFSTGFPPRPTPPT